MNKTPIHTEKSLFPDLEPDQDSDESWQVSYLDIITIVLGFLIILLSVSQFTKSPMSSLSTLFGKKSDETEYITTPIEEIQKELEILLRDQIALGNIEIVRDLNDVLIRFKGDDFYASGSTTLQPKARLILEDVMLAFQNVERSDFSIDVEGHTDNVPIRNARFPSNWELSTARASNVVNYFSENGIDEDRLKASGYADSRPVIQYDSLGFPYAAERDMNRRVVLRIFYTADQLRAANRDSLVGSSEEISDDDIINLQAERLAQLARNQPVQEGRIQRNNEAVNSTESSVDTATETEDISDESTSTEPPNSEKESEPEVVYSSPLPALSETPGRVPSFTDPGSRCQYSYQFGTANNLASAFREAETAENTLQSTTSIWLSGRQFSVRNTPVADLGQLINDVPGQVEGIVHQCATGQTELPANLTYQIQFGAFQSESNALDYVVSLFDNYGIQAYMTRSANTYNVVTGPFETRDQVSSEITRYRSLEVEANMFIKYTEQSMIGSGYLYQVLYARSSVESDLEPIRNQLNKNADIIEYDGIYLLLSPQLQDRNLAEQAIQDAISTSSALSPSLFLLEFY